MNTFVSLKRTLLLFVCFCFAVGSSSSFCPAGENGIVGVKKKPNVLFIAIDDLRPELGCYGSEYAITPNMDRLASQGLLFNRAYCQEAICAPSRASLMTGARPDTIGVIENWIYWRDKNPDIVTLSQHFIANGYEAVECGKIFHKPAHADRENSWSRDPSYDKLSHLPKPSGGFAKKENRQIWAENNKQYSAKYGKDIAKTGLVQGPAYESADVPDQFYRDGYNTDLAIATMKDIVAEGKPFFVGLGFYKPHLNFIAPKKYWDMYDPNNIPLATHTAPPQGGATMGLHPSFELRVRHGIPKKGPINNELARTLKHGYMACVSYVDAQIGRMLEALEKEGLRDNTIIIVWGDHGWHLGDMGVWGKATNYEIATRVPMMIWTPDMPKPSRGKKTDALVELVDMYPTLCELAGLDLPKHLEGTSFVPLLEKPQRKWETAAFSQFPSPALREWAANPLQQGMRETFFGPLITEVEEKIKAQQGEKWDRDMFENRLMGYSMRTDRYRLVVWKDFTDPKSEPIELELYDHSEDPEETVNVADRRPELVKRLLNQFNKGWKGNLPPESNEGADSHFPFTDPANKGGWNLNRKVSDEFNANKLDESKWHIQGKGGVYKSNWIGRAPSQFSTENVRLENGMLKIQSKWEPGFEFSDKLDKTNLENGEPGRPYENITTGAAICKNQFKYGYLEIRCKAANASVTSSFWGTGKTSELDVFEFVGAPSRPNSGNVGRRFKSNIISWKSKSSYDKRKWNGNHILNWRPADDFHIYGCDWSENGLKFYADGELIQSITSQELGDDWVLTEPISIWVDSETFPWQGLPKEESLPADYEIDYIRVWQRGK